MFRFHFRFLTLLVLLALCFVLLPTTPRAQEFIYYKGIMKVGGRKDASITVVTCPFALDVDDPLNLGLKYEWRIGYRNDGHPDPDNSENEKKDNPEENHRDGFFIGGKIIKPLASNIYIGNTKVFNEINIGMGLEPYYFYDTQPNDDYVRNFGVIGYSETEAKTPLGFSLFVRGEGVGGKNTIPTKAVMIGFAFDLSNNSPLKKIDVLPALPDTNQRNAIGFSVGVNDSLKKIELTHNLSDHLEISGSYYLKEEKSYGGAAQIHLVEYCFKNRLKFSLGAGPFRSSRTDSVYLLVTRSVAVQILPNVWIESELGRLPAHRRNNNDEDLFVVGVKYSL